MSWLDNVKQESMEDMGELNRHNFDLYTSTGTDIEKFPIIFNKTRQEIDVWCRKEYGLGFEDAYARILNIAAGQYADLVAAFAAEGHKTAMATMNDVLLKVKSDNVQKVQIVSDMGEDDE